ncbi:MAG: hypothetical protein GY898_11810 [Proteobacteria bacterium]|nr:hypothetical protein [Pseudomonadota bacterium]
MTRLLPLLLALLMPALAHADAPPLVEDTPVEEPAPPPPEDPNWQAPLIKDLGHHLGAWGVSTSALGGLEVGFMLSGLSSPPGWFQGATVNLMFIGIGVAGFTTNGWVLATLKHKTVVHRRVFAHHARRAAVGCLIIGSGLLHAMVWPILPALGWEGWSPEGMAFLAFPFGAFASAITLFYWAARAEPPRGTRVATGRPKVQIVAAGPTGITIRF